ncbi:hypothetical protein L484_005219 [Morus notabilis]|uniref:Uncharacterized protein n=1 Tax=Morus notabilis TaxID=981085 RepID=W9R8J2_9ROSA|nr:hypothetical protein L484_005219 [Morus notabilis]
MCPDETRTGPRRQRGSPNRESTEKKGGEDDRRKILKIRRCLASAKSDLVGEDVSHRQDRQEHCRWALPLVSFDESKHDTWLMLSATRGDTRDHLLQFHVSACFLAIKILTHGRFLIKRYVFATWNALKDISNCFLTRGVTLNLAAHNPFLTREKKRKTTWLIVG